MPTTQIERLKAIRAAHRGVCTKLERETHDLLQEERSNETSSRLEVISCLLDTKQKTLSDIDSEIVSLCDLADISKEIEESEAIIARIIECKKKINDSKSTASSEQPSIQGDLAQATATNVVKPKLPRITLPKFRGNVTQWISFWDSFKSAVHDNKSITTIDKFHILIGQLEGVAARSIQGLAITNDNYTAAVELLHERFGKTQMIITAHMDEILKIPASSEGRLGSLRYVYDKLCVHVRGLASLGVSADQYGSLLIPVIMDKLPSNVRLQVARKNTSEIWDIKELLNAIKVEVDAREASERTRTSSSSGQDSRKSQINNYQHSRSHSHPSANTLMVKQFKVHCAFCNGLHYSASCDKIVDYKARKEILSKNNRCFICIRKGHVAKDCTNQKKCRHCNNYHHQSICDQACLNKSIKTLESTTTPEEESKEALTEENPSFTGTTSTSSETNRKVILLQTARAVAVDESGEKSVPVEFFLTPVARDHTLPNSYGPSSN